MEKFIEVLKNNPKHTYDYICNNYYNYSKEELKDILKEFVYFSMYHTTKEVDTTISEKVVEELENYLE